LAKKYKKLIDPRQALSVKPGESNSPSTDNAKPSSSGINHEDEIAEQEMRRVLKDLQTWANDSISHYQEDMNVFITQESAPAIESLDISSLSAYEAKYISHHSSHKSHGKGRARRATMIQASDFNLSGMAVVNPPAINAATTPADQQQNSTTSNGIAEKHEDSVALSSDSFLEQLALSPWKPLLEESKKIAKRGQIQLDPSPPKKLMEGLQKNNVIPCQPKSEFLLFNVKIINSCFIT
jgi:hypothetical protein